MLAAIFCLLTAPAFTQMPEILPMNKRAQLIDQILEERIEQLLPGLMEETGIDMWVLISREYNEDPVLKTFLPATWLNARRRTILVFYRDRNSGVLEKLAVARYKVGNLIEAAWNKEEQPDQWQRLMEIIEERNPQTIGLNYSDDHNIADGLDHTDYRQFMDYLPKKMHKRVTSAEQLAVRWIETRTDREMTLFAHLVENHSRHHCGSVLRKGNYAWLYHHNGCGMVDEAENKGTGLGYLVSSHGRYSKNGGRVEGSLILLFGSTCTTNYSTW